MYCGAGYIDPGLAVVLVAGQNEGSSGIFARQGNGERAVSVTPARRAGPGCEL
jgi:hypothetical protein